MHAGGSHNSKESLRLIIMSMAMFLDIYCVFTLCTVYSHMSSGW